MEYIGHIISDYKEKFGIPRQSGLVASKSRIVLEPPFNDLNAVRELEGFDYIWLLWEFSENAGEWSSTVRPPKLGGNRRVGVFATRSPFHPNSIGLSCVRLMSVVQKNSSVIIEISGADLMDGTPILDIKPYLPYTDSHPDASAGWTVDADSSRLEVRNAEAAVMPTGMDPETLQIIRAVIAEDPRPGYQNDSTRIYGITYSEYNIKFRVSNNVAEILEIYGLQSRD